MSLDEATRQRIDSLIGSNRVVLFMKGTPQQPQCGFSATTVGILDTLVPDYASVNVLEDQQIREGIKVYSDWPTIPQLYIDQEFMGGCDVVKQMFNSGDLHTALGAEAPDRTPPEIALSDEAAKMMRDVLDGQPGMAAHLSIDARWQHNFALGPVEGHEVKSLANGVDIYMDVVTAQKARGMKVEVTESLQGTGFRIDNPNAPPAVVQMDAAILKAALDAGEALHLFDVRAQDERRRASIDGSRMLDEETMAFIQSLPKDTKLVFYCHSGPRSQQAAEHFRLLGYTEVHHLVGGIDAWSQQIDPSVPRY
ncbi:MAG: Grx4 family monothiol glutaredoxin [Gammaproteobacteria bacterium]|nr:Grx4 family monothiol glutaredoxin [Gammaproteobacteria bacterium]